ncbi:MULTISPECIES: efflux RND transporter permease subunit [unclassified Novosphingobium]|uniref:efflux RND transporter permease subunit n=1 Tax=unclassified Novosphingobium TaxID=2644732 RepID=UPI00086F41A9|nr:MULTISPECIES: efflux RND transporter permease subunit [unclassified Novosphingobium]MBN9144339.1 efflux RND transporter permease subunit [Novosphingobium sp.]MDR6707662.1 multidrug efflux pump subunit AcrB [Novosphingobium sp. 1748]ODU79453.1 MAG: acriflavin resistance protein [Novosphingobium sp. SCN 63-17]OJX93468.1 MAG: acriflavin resistance protein [Novosphingobium sp. 63-713]
MNLVHQSLRRPWTVVVLVLAMALSAFFGLSRMPRDVFPNLNVPTIYVAQPYGGLDPAQMEGLVTYYYEYHFLYITGLEHVESKSIQGATVLKLQFHPGTDMSQAMSETISYVNRARAFMPPGTVPPFAMRFDAGSVPVGNLVFSSAARPVGQMQDLALNTIRPMFATLPGVSAPPPFGGAPRTIVLNTDPAKLASYNLSLDDVVNAVARSQVVSPSGNIALDGKYPIVPTNAMVTDAKELESVPLRPGSFPAVHVGDVAKVVDGSDIVTSYALSNGRRTVYIPVTKRADASTLAVVDAVKANLGKFQAALPEDVTVSYEFDQSGFVTRAMASLTLEAALGALLTGVMVLLFLRDGRAALVVVVNIPLALLAASLALWLTGATINLMSLGGLALAVGILVDMSTVTMENIHVQLAQGKALPRAVADSGREVAGPLLIALLCVLCVFVPALFMQGAARALFLPMTLAVGFAMIASWLLDRTLVPVLAVWWLKPEAIGHDGPEEGLRRRYQGAKERVAGLPAGLVAGAYLAVAALVVGLGGAYLGADIFPQGSAAQLQLRLRAPAGTKLDLTEDLTKRALAIIARDTGDGVAASLALVGMHGSAYPINFIHQWNGGTHEAVLQVQLKDHGDMAALRDRLRGDLAKELPQLRVSFEPADIVSRVMSFGAQTPIEVAVLGKSLEDNRAYAEKIRAAMGRIEALRDVQIAQTLDYPAVKVTLDRGLAGLAGVSADNLTRSLTPFTSSSRFTQPVYWAANTGVSYQVQVQGAPAKPATMEDLRNLPVSSASGHPMLLRNVAQVAPGTVPGQFDRYNGQRVVSVTANYEHAALGSVAGQVQAAVDSLGPPPKGITVMLRGQVEPLRDILGNLQTGLLVAVLAIFLMLLAYFQSPGLALCALASVPAALVGVVLMLGLTGTTLNLESYMGAITATGVAVANAILLVSFAEKARIEGMGAMEAGWHGASTRLRPIVMTSMAMVAGMAPMALGLGESGAQTAPLGRAVAGGVITATLATLFVLPVIFGLLRASASRHSPSLDPDDPAASSHA